MQEHSVTGELPAPSASATADLPNDALALAQAVNEAAAAIGKGIPLGKRRAGYTTNKGHGTPKARRKMSAASRHRNRRK